MSASIEGGGTAGDAGGNSLEVVLGSWSWSSSEYALLSSKKSCFRRMEAKVTATGLVCSSPGGCEADSSRDHAILEHSKFVASDLLRSGG